MRIVVKFEKVVLMLLLAAVRCIGEEPKHLEPLDGRIGSTWSSYWKLLGQHENVPKGVPLVAMLVLSEGSPPYFIKVFSEGDRYMVFCCRAELHEPNKRENARLESGTIELHQPAADAIIRSYLGMLKETRYYRENRPRISGGAMLFALATDVEANRVFMGGANVEHVEELDWMIQVAVALRDASFATKSGGPDVALQVKVEEVLRRINRSGGDN